MTEELDPALCSFCEEEQTPAVGRMLVVNPNTDQEVVPYNESRFGACQDHGFEFSNVIVGHRKETDEVLVFRFQHQDFGKVADQVDSFAVYLDNLRCKMCDARIYEEGTPLVRIAKRMLQNSPEAHYLVATCRTCMAIHGCPDCDNHDDHH